MKSRLLIAAFLTALCTSYAAVAADTPAGDTAEPAAKAPPAKKKAHRHSHAEANKQGVAPKDAAAPADEPKKPLHEHAKENKQQ